MNNELIELFLQIHNSQTNKKSATLMKYFLIAGWGYAIYLLWKNINVTKENKNLKASSSSLRDSNNAMQRQQHYLNLRIKELKRINEEQQRKSEEQQEARNDGNSGETRSPGS